MKVNIGWMIAFVLASLTWCGMLANRVGELAPNAPTLRATEATLFENCTPTNDDGLSPTYKSGAPVRSVVGHGHVLTGYVLSSRECKPIANAKLEFWPEYAGLGHLDEARTTLYTDSSGKYRFECDPPEHIHMQITAQGYRTIANNSYHPEGQAEGILNIVLVPVSQH